VTYGENWPEVKSKQTELALIRKQLDEEKAAAVQRALDDAETEYLIADSRFQMIDDMLSKQRGAVSNYQSARTREDQLERTRRDEYAHIEHVPEGETEEIRQIFAAKGFSGDTLEKIVATITSDKKSWVETMLVEEHGLALESPRPLLSALATFAAFIVVGLVPLVPFLIVFLLPAQVFPASVIFSMVAFFAVGALKGHVLNDRRLKHGTETMLAGSLAAMLAYFAGSVLREMFGVA